MRTFSSDFLSQTKSNFTTKEVFLCTNIIKFLNLKRPSSDKLYFPFIDYFVGFFFTNSCLCVHVDCENGLFLGQITISIFNWTHQLHALVIASNVCHTFYELHSWLRIYIFISYTFYIMWRIFVKVNLWN